MSELITENLVIKNVQFKRGLKAILEQRLTNTDLGVLKLGEPAFEIDTGQLKIGNGQSDYADLEYVGALDDARFVIQDPIDNQILVYDSQDQKWINTVFVDNNSITYTKQDGLSIIGLSTAKTGYVLAKDSSGKVIWVKPLDDKDLQTAVANANAAANRANNYAVQAGTYASDAGRSAGIAADINAQTVSLLNKKFWWGTIDQYNQLTEIYPDTFYFITAEA